MHKRNANAHFNILQVFFDVLIIIASFFIAQFFYIGFRGFSVVRENFWVVVVFGLLFILSMFWLRMYDVTTFQYLDRHVFRTGIATTLASFGVSAVVFLGKVSITSRLHFILFVGISFVLLLGQRLLATSLRRAKVGNGYMRVLFIGNEELCKIYCTFISKTALKVKVVKRIEFDAPELVDENGLEKLLKELNVSEVVVVETLYDNIHRGIQRILQVAEDMGITTRLLLDTYELPESKRFVSNIGTLPVITYHSKSLDTVQLFFKTCLDILCSMIGIVLLSPVFLVTAIAIKLESPGPAIFCQTRVGQNGRKFKMYKFRSMYKDAEERKAELQSQNKIEGGLMFKMDDDPRITKVGRFIRKTSIDELPQLFNVIKLDMSLVGTRPPTVDEVEKYQRHHHRRISIKPGITGMWQVNGRSDILDFEHVVELDRKYIEQWTLWLDIKLVFKTVSAVIARRGAS